MNHAAPPCQLGLAVPARAGRHGYALTALKALPALGGK
jgi:hypothetical protein